MLPYWWMALQNWAKSIDNKRGTASRKCPENVAGDGEGYPCGYYQTSRPVAQHAYCGILARTKTTGINLWKLWRFMRQLPTVWGIWPVKRRARGPCIAIFGSSCLSRNPTKLKDRALNNQNYIEYIKQKIAARLQELNISAKIDGRVKSIYGIYRKVYMAGREFDEVI